MFKEAFFDFKTNKRHILDSEFEYAYKSDLNGHMFGTTEDIIKNIIEQYSKRKLNIAYNIYLFLQAWNGKEIIKYLDRINLKDFDKYRSKIKQYILLES